MRRPPRRAPRIESSGSASGRAPAAHPKRPRVHSHKPVRRKTESVHRMGFACKLRARSHPATAEWEGGERRFLKTEKKLSLGVLVALIGASVFAMRSH